MKRNLSFDISSAGYPDRSVQWELPKGKKRAARQLGDMMEWEIRLSPLCVWIKNNTLICGRLSLYSHCDLVCFCLDWADDRLGRHLTTFLPSSDEYLLLPTNGQENMMQPRSIIGKFCSFFDTNVRCLFLFSRTHLPDSMNCVIDTD